MSLPVRRLLAEYEAFHRDIVNRWTHAFGLPLLAVTAFHVLDQVWGLSIAGRPYGLGVLALALIFTYHALTDPRLGWLTNAVILALYGLGFLLRPEDLRMLLWIGLAAPLIGHVAFERQAPKLDRIGRFEMAGGLWLTAYLIGEPPLASGPGDL